MKGATNYLKMRVLGALEYAPGDSLTARYQSVSEMIFHDEDGHPRQFTWRTIQTWWYHYRQHGITEAPRRADQGSMRKVTPEDLLAAIEKTLPSFHSGKNATRPLNIQILYRACIEQGHLRRDQIAPNTFRRAVNQHNLLNSEPEESTKRRRAFAKAHANDLWQCDTLHGPYLHIAMGRDGKIDHDHYRKPLQVFLIAFIDDASRVIPHGEFFLQDNTENLIQAFQTALYKRGVPRAVYADNGSNYSSKEFGQIITRLGAILIHTPVRDGAAKGKIERFFRTVRDQFLCKNLDHITSLDELNKLFNNWVENTYHTREHSTLGMKPIDRFGLDLNRIQHLNISEFNRELFFLETTRKIRADNTFQFQNTRYEAPRELSGQSIQLRYSRFHGDGSTPVAYHDGERLGAVIPIDFISNDRKPNLNNF